MVERLKSLSIVPRSAVRTKRYVSRYIFGPPTPFVCCRRERAQAPVMPSSSTSRRRCSRHRARVGPMLPTGMTSSFERSL